MWELWAIEDNAVAVDHRSLKHTPDEAPVLGSVGGKAGAIVFLGKEHAGKSEKLEEHQGNSSPQVTWCVPPQFCIAD